MGLHQVCAQALILLTHALVRRVSDWRLSGLNDRLLKVRREDPERFGHSALPVFLRKLGQDSADNQLSAELLHVL